MPTETGWQLIQADPQLSRYSGAVTAQQPIVDLLEQPGQTYTIFVPNDAALNAVPDWAAIAADPDALMSFVRKNTVAGSYTVEQLLAAPPDSVRNLDGEVLVIDPLLRTINGATIVTPDVQSANGYVQTVNMPLVMVEPPTATTVAPATPEVPVGTTSLP